MGLFQAFKLIGYFPIKYIKDPWSKFDAVVVSLSWAAIFFEFGSVQAIRAMRAFRIVLVLKSAKGTRPTIAHESCNCVAGSLDS